jgi:N-glycosylase/DNA lyase
MSSKHFDPDEPQVSLSLMSHGLDLDSTLTSGQSFSWKRTADGKWRGWIDDRPCLVWSDGEALRAVGPGVTRDAVAAYFNLELSVEEIFATFPTDPWLERAREFAPGLRILRQQPWETLCNFICSSLKQIVQIEQINHELRRVFGDEIGEGLHSFPDAARLSLASEAKLRECRLGFRARHLYVAAKQIASSEISLDNINSLPTADAREHLMRVQGVGEKVANCILLFAYGRAEVFPIDVWVDRVLRRLYFKNNPRVKPDRLRDFANSHFGPYRGYAQQFLFHWIRKDPKALPAQKTAKARVRKQPADKAEMSSRRS